MIESLDGASRTLPPTLRQIAYLVELSERLNFRVAAEAQFVTQSTLSAGIKELETLLGVQLVERDNRHVRLTAVGEDVAARGRELLAAATDLAEAARSATRPLSGPLRLGAIPTIAPYLLPSVLPALRRAYGELKLYLREDLTERLLERLRAGGLDLALIALPFDTGDMYVRELFKDEFFFVAREADPAVREERPAAEDRHRRHAAVGRGGTACATTPSPPAVHAAAPGNPASRPRA